MYEVVIPELTWTWTCLCPWSMVTGYHGTGTREATVINKPQLQLALATKYRISFGEPKFLSSRIFFFTGSITQLSGENKNEEGGEGLHHSTRAIRAAAETRAGDREGLCASPLSHLVL